MAAVRSLRFRRLISNHSTKPITEHVVAATTATSGIVDLRVALLPAVFIDAGGVVLVGVVILVGPAEYEVTVLLFISG